MANKFENYSFRSTLAGAWALTDPNDTTQETNVVLPTTTYPTTGLNGSNFGRSNGAQPTATDCSQTNSGSDARLAGSHSLTSSAQAYQFDMGAGTYDFRGAVAHPTTTTRTSGFLFEGSYSQWVTDVGSYYLSFWVASTAFTASANTVMVSKTDKTVWVCTTSGTSGTVEPSGAGPTFTDGTAVWTKASRSVLAWFDGTTGAASNVIDQNNAVTAASNWAAQATIPITVSGAKGNTVTFLNAKSTGGTAAGTSYPRQMSFRLQQATLVDVPLFDEFGASTTAPALKCAQPSGMAMLRLTPSAGANGVANWSFGGDLGAYYTPTLIGTDIWAVTNGVPMPDSLAGVNKTLICTQTDAASLGSPHSTTFNCTVTSSQGKPTTGTAITAVMSTEAWLNKKLIDGVLAAKPFAGYQGQAFASDQAVTSGADLWTKLNALTPDGVSWYRLRLQNGSYTGSNSGLSKNFGAGGLLIEPDTGHDPDFSWFLGGLVISGLHVRNCKLVGDNTYSTIGSYLFRFSDPGPANGFFTRAIFENNRCGILWASGYVLTDVPNKASFTINADHGEQIEFINNQGWGCQGNLLSGVRIQRIEGNDFRECDGDFYRPCNAITYNSTQGVFADNHIYCRVAGNRWHFSIDYAGYSSAAHRDFCQVTKFQMAGTSVYTWLPASGNSTETAQGLQATASTWTASTPYTAGAWFVSSIDSTKWYTTTNGTSGTTQPSGGAGSFNDGGITWTKFSPWAVGNYVVNLNTNKIYQVASVTTGITAQTGTGPSTTGTGIVDGGVTWNFFANYTTVSNSYFYFERNLIVDKTTQATSAPDIQHFLNSNGARNCPVYLTVVNDIHCSTSGYGVAAVLGEAWVEYNTEVAPPASQSTSFNKKAITPNTGLKLRTRNNIVGQIPSIIGSTTANWGDVVVSFVGTDPNPGTVLNGPFALYYTNARWGYSVTDDGSQPVETFAHNVAYILRKIDRTAGHRWERYPLPHTFNITVSAPGVADHVTSLTVNSGWA